MYRMSVNILAMIIFLLFLPLMGGELLGTRFCYEEALCVLHDSTWKPVCHCDKDCKKYQDCCSDHDTMLGLSEYSCRNILGLGPTFLVTACPKEWSNDIIRKQCENIPATDEDPMTKAPVTHKFSGITYANIFCASCHGNDNLPDISFWPMNLKCPLTFPDNDTNMFHHLTFDHNNKTWGATVLGTFVPCSIQISVPESLHNISTQTCLQVTHNCSDNAHETDKRYAAVYNSITFSSYYHSVNETCNLLSLNHLLCLHTRHTIVEEDGEYNLNVDAVARTVADPNYGYSFPMLFDFQFSKSNIGVGKKLSCENGNQVYDPFFKRCRYIKTLTNVSLTSEGYKRSSYNTSNNCSTYYLESYEYTMSLDNLTVYVKEYNHSFTNEEFTILDDYRIEICEFFNGTNTTYKFTMTMNYTTLIGLGISIFFLILHLFAFFLCEELRKLSDKNLASLCFSLLSCYTVFIIMTEVADTGYWWCSAIGFVMYFTLMSSFTWSLVIGFDIWKTLQLAITKFKLKSGKQNVKFFCYSIFSWTVPLIMDLILYFLETVPNKSLLKPQIGEHSCWFGNRYALFVFLAVPSGIVMLLNFIFISWSTYYIVRTRSDANSRQHSVHLYIRLVVIMGLSWSFGLAAGYFDKEILWHIFIICNTLQGLFIFIAFTCRKRVLRHIRTKLGLKNYVNTGTTKTFTRQDNFTQNPRTYQ